MSTIGKEVSSRRFAECLEGQIRVANFDIIHARRMHELPAGLVAMTLSEGTIIFTL